MYLSSVNIYRPGHPDLVIMHYSFILTFGLFYSCSAANIHGTEVSDACEKASKEGASALLTLSEQAIKLTTVTSAIANVSFNCTILTTAHNHSRTSCQSSECVHRHRQRSRAVPERTPLSRAEESRRRRSSSYQ